MRCDHACAHCGSRAVQRARDAGLAPRHALNIGLGNNPFCYYRAATLKKRGRRERLIQREAASGEPYDFERFEIIEEDWPVA